MKRTLLLMSALVLLAACKSSDDESGRSNRPSCVSSHVEIHSGLGCFVYHDDGDNTDRPVRVWYYLPPVASKIVFVMHGSQRNARAARAQFLPYADRYEAMLVAPEFRKAHYPDSDDYGRGFVKDGGGTGSFRNRDDWTFRTVEEIFDVIKTHLPDAPATYSICGNSAGGHFVSRLAWLIPEARYDTAVGSNAGWYTLPITNEDYPNGIADFPIAGADIEAAYARKFVLEVGELDTDPTSYDLVHNPFTDAQGQNRYVRAQFYHAYMTADSLGRGVPFDWSLNVVPATGHAAREMAHTTALAIFEGVYGQPHTSLAPVADTYSVEKHPSRNYGSRSDVQVDGASAPKTGYMRFDLTGIAPGDFDVAALKVWIRDDSPHTFAVRAVPDSTWGESTLTWENAPPSGAEIGSTKGAYEDGYLYIAITDYVKAGAGGPISLSIQPRPCALESLDLGKRVNELGFFSREAPDRRPALELFNR